MNNPYADIPGPEWDPNSEMYLRDPGSTASSLLLDIGVAPTDGATYRGLRPPPVPEGVKGRYVMTGVNQGPNQQGRDGSPEPYIQQAHGNDWVFMGEQEQAPQMAAPQQMADDPAPGGPTIYDSTADWINIARAEDQGRNRMPFVGPNWSEGNKTYADVPYDPLLSLEMFYPSEQNKFQQNNKSPYEGGLLSESLGGMGGSSPSSMAGLGDMVRSGTSSSYPTTAKPKAPGTQYDLRASLR